MGVSNGLMAAFAHASCNVGKLANIAGRPVSGVGRAEGSTDNRPASPRGVLTSKNIVVERSIAVTCDSNDGRWAALPCNCLPARADSDRYISTASCDAADPGTSSCGAGGDGCVTTTGGCKDCRGDAGCLVGGGPVTASSFACGTGSLVPGVTDSRGLATLVEAVPLVDGRPGVRFGGGVGNSGTLRSGMAWPTTEPCAVGGGVVAKARPSRGASVGAEVAAAAGCAAGGASGWRSGEAPGETDDEPPGRQREPEDGVRTGVGDPPRAGTCPPDRRRNVSPERRRSTASGLSPNNWSP